MSYRSIAISTRRYQRLPIKQHDDMVISGLKIIIGPGQLDDRKNGICSMYGGSIIIIFRCVHGVVNTVNRPKFMKLLHSPENMTNTVRQIRASTHFR